MNARFTSWESYCYPETSTLRNKRDIRDAGALRAFEEASGRIRIAELVTNPIGGNFDRAHMKAIHRHVFGDVYEWAGDERAGPQRPKFMSKNGPSVEDIRAGRYDAPATQSYNYFPADEAMVEHFDAYARLLRAGDLSGMSSEQFSHAIAEPWGEMNVAHLFREGNTRTQVAFFGALARRNGHSIDYVRFSRDKAFRMKFNAGRFLIQAEADSGLFAETLAEIVDVADDPADFQQVDSGAADDYQPNYMSDGGAAPQRNSRTPEAQPRDRKGRFSRKTHGIPPRHL